MSDLLRVPPPGSVPKLPQTIFNLERKGAGSGRARRAGRVQRHEFELLGARVDRLEDELRALAEREPRYAPGSSRTGRRA